MHWLTNWDDLTHGTAVFSAAIPLLVALLLGAKVPIRLWWLVMPLALVISVLWLFGLPQIPPAESDDVVMSGLLAGVVILALESLRATGVPVVARIVLRILVFEALLWCVYPAWLAMDGGLRRKLLICGGLALAVALWSTAMELLGSRFRGRRLALTPVAFIPPTIALAILLETGGSIRFGQALGALAAALGGLCAVSLFRLKAADREGPPVVVPDPCHRGLGRVGAFWGMLFILGAASGWLFAEVRYGLAALLLCAPLAALLLNLLPILPRKNLFLTMLWEFLASAAVSVPIAVLAWSQYAAEMSEFEGY